MPKINKEEYEILKSLDDKWKWIARDKDGVLGVYDAKVVKTKFHNFWIMAIKKKIDSSLFSFIQWEDEEPYNIAELIEEYEHSADHVSHVINERVKSLGNAWNESEETEVKKDKQWLINKVRKACDYEDDNRLNIKSYKMVDLINQLDEPEVLSQEWIESNSVYASSDGVTEEYIHVDDLQNLLVPKQEKVKIPYFIEEHIQSSLNYSEESTVVGKIENYMLPRIDETELDTRVLKFFNTTENIDLVALAMITENYEVEEEQKYYVVKSEGLDGVHYYFTKFDDEMNGLFTLPNDKKGAYRFDDKEKAQAIANYTDGKVEELEE